MDSAKLKYLAIIAMTCDHIAYALLPPDSIPYYLLRLFGKLTAPIMAFMLTEGYRHTRSRKKYLLRLSFFALVTQPFYCFFCYETDSMITMLLHWNVMYTLAVSLVALMVKDSKLHQTLKCFLLVLVIALAGLGDWSFILPVWVLILASKLPWKLKASLFSLASIALPIMIYPDVANNILASSFIFGTVLALIPIYKYNGQKGKKSFKYLFYIYYPAHLILILIAKAALT